jgi:hypothetical protein
MQHFFAYFFFWCSIQNALTFSTNHSSNRLSLSSAESKQNMAKIAFYPAYFSANCVLITLAIISFTPSICLCSSSDGNKTDDGDDGRDTFRRGGRGGGEGLPEATAAVALMML